MFFPATVTHYPALSKNAHHVVTYGTPVNIFCKYQELTEKIQDSNGNEVITAAWLLFPALTSINYDDKILLPDGSSPQILKINHIRTHMNIESCVEVYLGKGAL